MANKNLKSIKFPNLPDTYIIPQGTVTEADLEEAEGTKADAIVLSASGEIASYDDGGDLPMKSLKVNIVPKQSGTGDPSPQNIRPISGTDEVEVAVTHINAWDEEWEVGSIDASGNLTSSSTAIRSKNFNPIIPNAEYYCYVGKEGAGIYINFYDENKAFISRQAARMTLVATPSNARYFKLRGYDPEYGNAYLNDISINYPSTDTEYHSGKGDYSKSISLPQIVYGGTLDVVSGKLIITHSVHDMGEYNYSYTPLSGGRNMFTISIGGMKPSSSNDEVPSIVASMYSPASYNASWEDGKVAYSATAPTTNLGFLNNAYSDASAFKTAMTGQKFTVPLATPTEIDLTPTEVKSLLGDNNVWSDSGTVEVEYRADTSLVINKILEALEG